MPTQFRSSYMGKTLTAAGLAGSLGFSPTNITQRNFPKSVGDTSLMPFNHGERLASESQQLQPEDFARTKAEVEEAFVELLAQWRTETRMVSNEITILMHPAHYKIIGMGPQALPHIFADLINGGGPWFLALESITHENPVLPEHKRSAKLIRTDWILWGKEHGYVTM